MAETFDKMRARLTSLMKSTDARDLIEKGVLKVAIGAIENALTSKKQGGKPLTHEQEVAIVSEIVKGNTETLAIMADKKVDDPARLNQLTVENEILSVHVPKELTDDEIRNHLIPYADKIRSALKMGMGTGIAMKHFKEQKIIVDGKRVEAIIKEIRGEK